MHSVVDFSNVFVIIFLVGSTVSFIVNQVLEAIDYRHRTKNGGVVPEVLRKYPESEVFDKEKLKRITEYENAKYFSWIPYSILTFALKILLVIFGFYVFLYNLLVSWFGEPTTVGRMFLCFFVFSFLSGIPDSIIDIPYSLYKEFKLEKRFGFSNMTFKLWLMDGIKNLILSGLLAVMLTGIASLLFISCETYWWAVIAGIMMVFIFVMNIIYPKFIAPIFNKFQPLEEGELRTRLETMLGKAGFSSDGLFVMDASKRSGHSNAYFTGFGKAKRIVLYDTLIKSLTVDEIESVMAHEVGHYKLKHIMRRMISRFPLILVGSYVLFVFAHMESLYTGFGFRAASLTALQFIGIELVLKVFSSMTLLVKPITSILSRKDEYAADRYSAKLCKTGKPLVTALIKLNSENLNELVPPKIYSFFHYSHPTLVERTMALEAIEGK